MQPTHSKETAVIGKLSLKARLEAYYSLVAPEILADQTEWRSKFEQIFAKYGGSHEGETKLGHKLAKKYGTAVRLLVASRPTDESLEQIDPPKAPRAQTENPDWYDLRPTERNSGEISFVSTRFDPVAALSSSVPESLVLERNPWLAQCFRLDTVGQFGLHLPTCDPLRIEPTQSRKRPTPFRSDSLVSEKITLDRHPIETIAQQIERGPLSRLHDFRKQRVRVVVRYVNAIRGTLVGTLVTFDGHMNLILRDAEETYTMRPTDSTQSNVEREKTRLQKLMGSSTCSEEEWFGRKRQMKNLLVRGDNVVMISKAEQKKQVSISRYVRVQKNH